MSHIETIFYLQLRVGNKPHCKFLTEYFAFLLDFAKMGDPECIFLLRMSAISTMANFFLYLKNVDNYVSYSNILDKSL